MDLSKVKCRQRNRCAICDEKLDSTIVLPQYPFTETYVTEITKPDDWKIDQEFMYCKNCGHGQLKTVIPQDILYGNVYRFRTSKSTWGATKGNHYLIDFIDKTTEGQHFKQIIEVGCNDAYLLQLLDDRADNLIGIDPVLENDVKGKIKLIGDFYENTDINVKGSLVITHQVMEHLEEPKEFLKKLLKTADEETIFVFAFPSLDYILADGRFDQIFHHHLHYFSLHSTMYLLNEIGCKCIAYDWNPNYWGTLLIAFKKSKLKNKLESKIDEKDIKDKYNEFKNRMSMTNSYLQSIENDNVYGYGAGLQLPLLNYYVPNINKLKTILDDDPNKDGLYCPGLKPQIKFPKDEMFDENISIVITAINFSRPILKNIIEKNPKRIYLPFNNI